jgi:hypothetical protein
MRHQAAQRRFSRTIFNVKDNAYGVPAHMTILLEHDAA